MRSKLSNAGIRGREKHEHAKHDLASAAQRSRLPIRRLGAAVITGVLLVAALGIIGTTASQATYTFTNKTTANGLGNDFMNGVYAVGSTVYAATSGGLSISTDGGASFTNYTTTNGLGNNSISGVYAVGSTVYAATNGGLSISTDGGASFTNKTNANGLGSNTVRGVYVVGSTVYVATFGGGLSISTDGGASFTNYTTADGLANNSVNGVYVVGSTVYAATNVGLSIYAASGGGSGGGSGSQAENLPAPVMQQFGKMTPGTCDAVAPESLNWSGVASGGWTQSWAEWVNSGTGGAVCTRTLIYSSSQSRWVVS